MKSIKPGRGPSAMGSIGAICAAVFGVLWIAAAVSMGAPPFFCLFGVVFVVIAIAQAVYHYKNATGKNRFSSFDITEEGEEPDPLESKIRQDHPEPLDKTQASNQSNMPKDAVISYCPYCGAKASADYSFCMHCGKKLPSKG